MCCAISTIFLLGPRAGIIFWWIVQPTRWDLAFSSWFWPVLGFLFAPWTTLMYVAVAGGGVHGFDWVWIALAIFVDLASYSGSGWGNRDRIPGRAK